MQIGVVGLGRMGGNIARRLMKHGHQCVVFDQNPAAGKALADAGAVVANDLTDMVRKLNKPRVVWLMLPQGPITQGAVDALSGLLESGDIVIDGGNAYFRDDIRRSKALGAKGIGFVDCGTSGGVWGFERGYCLMIGGPRDTVEYLDPIFAALAPGEGSIPKTPKREGRRPSVEKGYVHCGPAGAGRFVKMVHNGIEYGLMQAYAEGFEILEKATRQAGESETYDFDLADIAEVWRRGSVIGSWLLDLTAIALAKDPKLAGFSGYVDDSGEGRWTVEAAVNEAVPAPVLTSALYARFRSRIENGVADKLLSAMRNEFGGHVESHHE
ncbi:MAG: decarboxylating 6-phosphogluconate dehydrogenase [Alphaproteobacteria bacterium]|nr:decarboxylating 6-phosphogluconate dehydrogenase [Alphaproteobacteria bacterium]MBL6938478.1 decarboxylating 6-phosphogluconate dehydrogenase [Alphaproteobacteria bacterium]MBL7096537.1 decarboxylating 6-phosphogluconate dehydrogenase [Alphaproteobacteria bacterium]